MAKVRRLERLARREEKNIVKRIFLLSVFSGILILIIFTVGIPFLGNLADFSSKFLGRKDEATQEVTLEAPILSELPDYTHESKIKVSGFSSSGDNAIIYINDKEQAEVMIENGTFTFQDVELIDGNNEIKVKAKNSSAESEFSQLFTIVFDDEEPTLEISAPSEGQEFSGNNRVKIEGKTEPAAQVFAAGFLVNVAADGIFDVTIPLIEGDNDIEIKAIDEAGNTKTVKILLKFKK